MRALAAVDELSFTAASVLASLTRRGPMRLSNLAVLEGVRQPTMTEVVSRLERNGLVRRKAEAGDRRALSISVTRAGSDVVARRRRRRDRALMEALSGLTAEELATPRASTSALVHLAEAAAAGKVRP